jgi:GTPase SAR1 family protein
MNESRGKKLHIVPELDRREFSVIVGWLEKLRESGLINMFGASPILNWTKNDLHRWLYGQSMDLESIERAIEELEYENEDGENDSEIDSMREQAEIIEYLLEKKQAVRDVLIRAALKRIDRTNGDHETKNVQRVFEKLANEAFRMWTSVVYDW